MGSGPFQIAGLKCSFHRFHIPSNKNKLKLNHRLYLMSSDIYFRPRFSKVYRVPEDPRGYFFLDIPKHMTQSAHIKAD